MGVQIQEIAGQHALHMWDPRTGSFRKRAARCAACWGKNGNEWLAMADPLISHRFRRIGLVTPGKLIWLASDYAI